MLYLLALIIAISIGVLTLRLIVKDRLSHELVLFLGSALGLGMVGQIIFYVQLIGHNFNFLLPPFLSLLILGALIYLNKKAKNKLIILPKNSSLLILLILVIPLWMEALFFSYGGWDAWSCWNLKAKFIYLGHENWKDMFSPILWRSNTGYPLSLPTINVWFWQWTGFSQNVPMFNAILLTLLTAGVLLLGLQALQVPVLPAVIITLSVFTIAFGNTLCISQYSDILFSLYLLCTFVCYLLFERSKDENILILSALFIGLLSFTKNEGLAACGILFLLILIQRLKKPWTFISIVFLAALPTIIFTLSLAPHSDAFINGLFSPDRPSTLERFLFILASILVEFIHLKWMGLWIVAILAIALGWKKAFQKPLMIIGLFMAAYLTVTIAYYQINTFFGNISWWIDYTLNRIIFALMPTVFLWVGISCFSRKNSKKDV